MEQFGELAPTVQILDAPVKQSGDQLVEPLKNEVEQAIEVPKIFLLDDTHSVLYLVCRSWWNSWWMCQFRRGPSWHATETWRAAFGAAPLRMGVALGSFGGCWVLNTTSGSLRRGSPPAQGGIKYWARLTVFRAPLYLAVACLTPCLPEEYLRGLFWEMTFGGIPNPAAVGSTVDTFFCQSTEAPGFRWACCVLVVGGRFAGFCLARVMKNSSWW